ncbi:protein kinase domain-containing protein [Herpetosiphon giganteus]|uniref:protein kinase domain-containing protein n=1 Tax=Herpetosiphon giganteus TaxID=2029754 RepID=UPI00195623B6|nr:serine/threonine protein kinase [Herpetosiphon giganteus]
MAILDKLLSRSDDADNLKGVEFKVGDIIDQRYLVRNVRKGFMGLVYIARDLRSEQTVAMKTFQAKFTWVDSAIANFTREAEVWMRLGSHPNVVEATRIVTIAGRPHIVMEFVPGVSLREMMRRGRLRFKHILDFAIQICWGMQYAYDRCNLIHRDLKPDNVMVTPEGIAKVTDFGLAQGASVSNKVRWGHDSQHNDSKIVTHASDLFGGSQPYMSPEQRAPGTPLGTTSDIYAMGVMLYEMMIGDLPFKAPTVAELTHLHCNVPPPTPSEVRPDLRRGCDHVILRCLAKKANDRYQSFDELEHDLQWLRKYHLGEELARPTVTISVETQAADLNAKGIVHMSLHEYSAALKCFRQATELESARATYWLNLGMCQVALLGYNDALKSYEHALTLYPTRDEEVRLHWLSGESHEYLYQLREALEDYDLALNLDKKERRAWLGRGRVYSALALPKEAFQAYEYASKLDPNDPITWRSMGYASLELNQAKQALYYFDQALKVNPRDAQAWCGKGQAFFDLRKNNDALQAYEKAYKLDANLAEAVMGMAKVRGPGAIPR